jgi:hypothetical protein
MFISVGPSTISPGLEEDGVSIEGSTGVDGVGVGLVILLPDWAMAPAENSVTRRSRNIFLITSLCEVAKEKFGSVIIPATRLALKG